MTAAAKSAMRKELMRRREDQTGVLDLSLFARLPFSAMPDAVHKVVSGFHPFGDEIDTRPLLGQLAGEGWTTCLPVVVGKGMPLEFRRWFAGEPLIAGRWGILRPGDGAETVEPDVLLVPMLAFDRGGYRLGYGGGFYDRTLAGLRAKKSITAIGVAYSAQEVDVVPRDAHDQRLDFIMTEKEVFACG
jgi:5-formyltetrahydrofolate cyclo-ligase